MGCKPLQHNGVAVAFSKALYNQQIWLELWRDCRSYCAATATLAPGRMRLEHGFRKDAGAARQLWPRTPTKFLRRHESGVSWRPVLNPQGSGQAWGQARESLFNV